MAAAWREVDWGSYPGHEGPRRAIPKRTTAGDPRLLAAAICATFFLARRRKIVTVAIMNYAGEFAHSGLLLPHYPTLGKRRPND